MELHHKLRRDPSWHPSSCNICGQMGHQAANCTVGTVDWVRMYGENAFRMLPPVFQSDLDRMKKAKQINFEELEKKATEFAKMRRELKEKNPEAFAQQSVPPPLHAVAAAAPPAMGMGMPPPGGMGMPPMGMPPMGMPPMGMPPMGMHPGGMGMPPPMGMRPPGGMGMPPYGGGPPQHGPGAGAPSPVPPPGKPEEKKEESDLPEGWAVAYDAQKRPYYWHRQTKKTVWEKPTPDTPTS